MIVSMKDIADLNVSIDNYVIERAEHIRDIMSEKDFDDALSVVLYLISHDIDFCKQFGILVDFQNPTHYLLVEIATHYITFDIRASIIKEKIFNI